jgi:DNA-binding SARP family transcriptional activator
MGVEYRLLGPLEVTVDGRPTRLGPPKQRATLALLLGRPNLAVPAARLVDALWGDDPPGSAANQVQGYVSGLRKALGKEAIETRGAGYVLRVAPRALDLQVFEELADEGSRALERGEPDTASSALGRALALWRGPALADLADEPELDRVAGRLDELRVLALERRVEAELALGRHADVVGELEELIAEHPLRERPRGLLMTALARSGRQAEALEAFRQARATLVDELGIEPSGWLCALHSAILRQDPALALEPAEAARVALRSVLAAALAPGNVALLGDLAAPLAREPRRELLLLTTVASAGELEAAGRLVNEIRTRLVDDGIEARGAAFTSVAPGADMARLAREDDVDLLLVDAPAGLLEDARLLALLDQSPCDVGVVVGGAPSAGPVVVPFAGAEHDWAAVELGAWFARSRGVPLRVAGAATGGEGRDASRLLASASIAVQRTLGVAAEPVLVDPAPDALVEVAREAGIVVLGLTERWRTDGLGRTRTAVATQTASPTILVRRGTRPGGLAPRESATRFTWTIAG